jgi:hypothetical protein
MPNNRFASRPLAILFLALFLAASLLQALPGQVGYAQNASPPVQIIEGKINPGEVDVFLLSGLQKGQILYALLQNTSGNLDPALSVASAQVDLPSLIATYQLAIQKLVETSENPLVELPALNDATFLAWDDDSGPGYSAALTFVVPQDGDYLLGATGALSAAGRITFGDYRLTLGVDALGVLDGTATPSGATIAIQDDARLARPGRVQEIRGSFDTDRDMVSYPLTMIDPGETLTVYAEATSGAVRPVLILRDYGGKPVRVGNLAGSASSASLQYLFPEGAEKYTLELYSSGQDQPPPSGEFRLLAGIDAPGVLDGTAEPNNQDVLQLPIEVQTGLKLQQIVAIDQQNEIMTAVGTIKLAWKDPRLAFSPDECNCTIKQFTDKNFDDFLEETGGNWPEFTFFNQQGNRWMQNRTVEITPDGSATYLERFTTNFQLNFDFAQYPFDTEQFYISADLLAPEDEFVMTPMEGFSTIDPDNGEDEFILTDWDTSVSSVLSSQEAPTSRFTFHWSAPRYQMYYLFRIFVPILLIISVSYVTFFLKDFTRRIEVATGNLLLFIAFSWSLAEDYPRMGYLTFLDVIMAITFVVNTLVVIYNVYLKYLENKNQLERAERIDRVADWVYPFGYLALFGITVAYFFL